MKRQVNLNLPDDFILTSELLKQMDNEPNEDKRYKLYSTFFAEWRKEMIMNMSEQDFVIDVIQRKKELGIDQMG